MVRSSYVHTYVFSSKESLITRFFELIGELIQFAKKVWFYFKISKNREFRRDNNYLYSFITFISNSRTRFLISTTFHQYILFYDFNKVTVKKKIQFKGDSGKLFSKYSVKQFVKIARAFFFIFSDAKRDVSTYKILISATSYI